MKTLITGIVFCGMTLLGPATTPLEVTMAPAPEAANVSSPVEIVAPVVELAQVEVQVATEAAPVVEVEVPEVVAEVVTPVEVQAELAVCHEEDPCWNCETMGNLTCGPWVPAEGQDPVAGNSNFETVESCQRLYKVLAEDGSCVETGFWDEEVVEGSSAATLPDCNDPELGDAFAGMAVTCTLGGVELGFAAE